MAANDTKFGFTKRRLEAIKPATGRVYYQDDAVPGLNLLVTPNGAKSFYVVKKFHGRKVRVRLGGFPEMAIEQARKACQQHVAAMAGGIDVQASKQAQRREQTIEGLFGFWLDDAKARAVRTWNEEEKRFKRYLKPWSGRKLSSIQKSDVQALFTRVSSGSGIYAANKLLALLKAMFHRAADMGFSGADPTAGVKKHREEKRDRFLHADELKGFFRALFAEQNTTLRDLLLVALLTGARKGNVAAMRWAEIDFASNLWRIPTTKSGKPVVVPLVPPAVALLKSRKETTNGSEWVFPSNRGSTGHITEVKSAWKRVMTGAKLENCRPHDLRRSLASYMAISGSSLPTIGSMLGHSQPSTTAIYARLSTDPVRAAAETAATAMLTYAGATISGDGMTIDVSSDEEDKSNGE